MKKRKTEHLNLALQSQTRIESLDERFFYEPLFAGFDTVEIDKVALGNKILNVPVWVSSMTGGAEFAGLINRNLARACREFGMGMGLGSCRVLLEENNYRDHFDLRDIIGDEAPLYANFGIGQIEKSIISKSFNQIEDMVRSLRCDGLIIHINPLQEWLQPEGDILKIPPIEAITHFMEQTKIPLIVKEVGQGMGYESLKALLKLPLIAIEFGAFGGTNFARIELERSNMARQKVYEPLAYVGNSAYKMTEYINRLVEEDWEINTQTVIASGGIKNYLDGYFFIKKLKLPAIYGQASAFLEHAREDYDILKEYIGFQLKGLRLAYSYLRINHDFRI